MLYAAYFMVCLMNPINGWMGDTDTGPTCVKVYDTQNLFGYQTVEQCDARLKEMYQDLEKIQIPLPLPWKVEGYCQQQRLYEVFHGSRTSHS